MFLPIDKFINNLTMNLQLFTCFILIFFICSCSHSGQQDKPVQIRVESKSFPKDKPPSSYSDTLIINSTAAVFYSPDSVQLEKLRSITDKGAFDANLHEYYFLTRNARLVIKKN